MDFTEMERVNLLDSMKALLEKERILHSMQLEEKQIELERWQGINLQQEDEDDPSSPNAESSHDESKNISTTNEAINVEVLGRMTSSKEDIVNAFKQCETLQLSGLLMIDGETRQEKGKVDLSKIIPKLKWLPHLKKIELRHNFLDDQAREQMEDLLDLPARHGYILDLSHNHFGPETATMLTIRSSMKSRPLRYLQSIQLQGSQFMAAAPGFGMALGNSLASGGTPQLWGLGVTLHDVDNLFARPIAGEKGARRGQPYKPMNAFNFLRALPQRQSSHTLPSIEYLNLAHGSLSKRSLTELAAHCLHDLSVLDLTNCFIGYEGAAILAKGLASPSAHSLATLILSGNMLGSVGAQAIAESLTPAKNCSLTQLNISNNVINSAGGLALAKAMTKNPVITLIDVGDNPLNEEAVGCLMEAFLKRPRQKSIGFPMAFQLRGLDTLPISVTMKQLFLSALKAHPVVYTEEEFAAQQRIQTGLDERNDSKSSIYNLHCEKSYVDGSTSEKKVVLALAGKYSMNLAASGGSWV